MKKFLRELFCWHNFKKKTLSYYEYVRYKPIRTQIAGDLLLQCTKCNKNNRKDIDKILAYHQSAKMVDN